MVNPIIYLIENLSTHLTFPMILGVMQAKGLMPRTNDPYEDGLLLLRHIQDMAILDKSDQSITLEMCGGLGVPVLHLRDRSYVVDYRDVFPSVFPIEPGPAKGRLGVRRNVETERIPDLAAFYGRFYDHPKYGHTFALNEQRMSRDKARREWVEHEDTQDFSDAMDVLTDCEEELAPISE